MKVIALLFVSALACCSSYAQPSGSRCLIVKHKGTVGRRLMFTALIGVPIAPGSKYDYVDSINMGATKTSYGGKELQAFEGDGVHVVVLNNKYAVADLRDARESCKAAADPNGK